MLRKPTEIGSQSMPLPAPNVLMRSGGKKAREAGRRWYSANSDDRLKADRQRRAVNPEQDREYARRYRTSNPDKRHKAVRQWQRANPQKVREITSRWRAAHPATLTAYNALRRARRRRAIPAWLSREQCAQIAEIYRRASFRWTTRRSRYTAGRMSGMQSIRPPCAVEPSLAHKRAEYG